jgi:hypothetical protein
MDDNDRYLMDINKDNLARVIGFASTYDSKANFVLTLILALTAYLIAELPSYVDAHARHCSAAQSAICSTLPALAPAVTCR